MKLFHSPTSPFVRKVKVLLIESGHLDDVELVAASGTPLDPATMPVAHNPLGKIPTLIRDDGRDLFDSRVICRYLDHRFDTGLYPAPPRLWDSTTLEALADGICDAAILMVYEARLRPEDCRHDPWVQGQWAKIVRALDSLEGGWADHLDGPLCMGQIALGCALSYLDFRHDERNWRANRPLLAEWESRIKARDSMKATVPVE